ncbi:MAG TPA: hypothetical protein PKA76_19350 [Pirellulaceae bacterium]|nr:hypothetical protein [Pirellulaceae bacterium]
MNLPDRKVPVGCIVAVIILSLSVVSLMLVVVVAYLAMSDAIKKQFSTTNVKEDLQAQIAQDIEASKKAFLRPVDVRVHSEYERLIAFIDQMQSVLDETVNPELGKLIDFEFLMSEIFKRSRTLEGSSLDRQMLHSSLQRSIIGPAPFSSYEVTHIENEGRGRYRVYLSYSTGYRAAEPHIWWLSDKGQLKIYDWLQVDLGIRNSLEDAILWDAPESQIHGHNKYSDLCFEYLGTSEKDLSPFQRKQLVRRILIQCEQFSGPPTLLPVALLITARRWFHEGDDARAQSLLEKIADPQIAPGALCLAGDIHFDRREFPKAVEYYQKYVELAGPTPHAQSRLAQCFREIGNTEMERQTLFDLTRTINENRFLYVAQLVELNDESQNQELFSRIDLLPNREAAYTYLVWFFSESPYFADRLKQIHEHLQKSLRELSATLLASSKLDPTKESLAAYLQWIDEHCEEDPEGLRFEFWYGLDDAQIIDVLESCSDLKENFDTICDVYDYEGSISDETLLAACQWVLSTDTENFKALYRVGIVQKQRQDFQAAIDSLQQALKAMPDTHEEAPLVRAELLDAYYQSGDTLAALDFATDAELATELLRRKAANEDFADFAELLGRLDGNSNEFKFNRALLLHHQTETDAALRILVDLVQAAYESEQFDYRIFQYEQKLLEICEQQGDITRAFALQPSDDMFRLVTRQLVQSFDWPSCERLLRAEIMADKRAFQVQLRQHIDWGQGKYEEVIEHADAISELAESADLTQELERLVRAALRLGRLDVARDNAQVAADLADLNELVVLVALLQSDVDRFNRYLPTLSQYQIDRLYIDPDLINSAWRENIPAEKLPPRSLSYYSTGQSPQVDLRLLFSESQKYLPEQLQAALAPVLGDSLQVERVEESEQLLATWMVHSNLHRIVISQDTVDGVRAAATCQAESLKEAIGRSTCQLRLIGFANTPTTAQSDYELSVGILKCLANDKLCAVGNGLRWLAANDVFRCMDQVAEQRPPRLFVSRDYLGEVHYLDHEDSSQPILRDHAFRKELALALKRFNQSSDPDKSFVVQLAKQYTSAESISAKLNRVRRTGYGSVTLDVSIEHDARIDLGFRQGDKVGLGLHQIDGFQLRESDEVLRRNRLLE